MLVKRERRQRLQSQIPDAGTSSQITKEIKIPTSIQIRPKVPRRNRRGKMASVPYMAMHTATNGNRKKRQSTASAEPGMTFASAANSDALMQYSSKMMNSIWGMYNKYSVHNLKSLQGGNGAQAEGQAEGMSSSPDSGAGMANIGSLSYSMASTMWESASHY